MLECLFCKIARGEIPAFKIDEDDKFLAILDINPNTEGMTIILPKEHTGSDLFALPDESYGSLFQFVKRVAKRLERGLDVKRVAVVSEGMGVDHLHIKLYPLHGLTSDFVETWADGEIFFEKYEGYVTTMLGPKANENDLKLLAEKLKKA